MSATGITRGLFFHPDDRMGFLSTSCRRKNAPAESKHPLRTESVYFRRVSCKVVLLLRLYITVAAAVGPGVIGVWLESTVTNVSDQNLLYLAPLFSNSSATASAVFSGEVCCPHDTVFPDEVGITQCALRLCVCAPLLRL